MKYHGKSMRKPLHIGYSVSILRVYHRCIGTAHKEQADKFLSFGFVFSTTNYC